MSAAMYGSLAVVVVGGGVEHIWRGLLWRWYLWFRGGLRDLLLGSLSWSRLLHTQLTSCLRGGRGGAPVPGSLGPSFTGPDAAHLR